MTLLNEPPVTSTTTEAPVYTPRRPSIGKAIVNWATSTDHKTIGYMYIFTFINTRYSDWCLQKDPSTIP